MVTATPLTKTMPRVIADALGVTPPIAPPDFVGTMFGRKTAPPPPSI